MAKQNKPFNKTSINSEPEEINQSLETPDESVSEAPAEALVITAEAAPVEPVLEIPQAIATPENPVIVNLRYILDQYATEMAHNKVLVTERAVYNQRELNRVVTTWLTLHRDSELFAKYTSVLVKWVAENLDEVLADTHVYRFMNQTGLSQTATMAHADIISILKSIAVPSSRSVLARNLSQLTNCFRHVKPHENFIAALAECLEGGF